MLRIIISLAEGFDEETSKFVTSEGHVLDLEHSLISLSKWEAKYEKPFFSEDPKTEEQVRDYIKMMILGEIPPGDVLNKLSEKNIEEINTYISSNQTATWFNEKQSGRRTPEVVTAEVIYYWMISLSIPFECQYWHLNRLITLIRVCSIKNAPRKKMSKAEAMAQQRSLNAARRAASGSNG
jgi:hypothetical protein